MKISSTPLISFYFLLKFVKYMNIFMSFDCPLKCAIVLDDKRINKMILESTQMLSTCVNILQIPEKKYYKSCYINHPCNIWVQKSFKNYIWLYEHLTCLLEEYKKRFKKTHKCEESLIILNLKESDIIYFSLYEKTDILPKTNLFKNFCVDIYDSYKLTLLYKWNIFDKRKPTWGGSLLSFHEQLNILEIKNYKNIKDV